MNDAIESLVSIIEAQKNNLGTSYRDAIAHWSDYKTFWGVGEALWKVLASARNRTFVPLSEIDIGEAVYIMAVDKVYENETSMASVPVAGNYLDKYIGNLRKKHNTEVGLEDAEHTKEDVEKIWESIINPPSLDQEEEEDEDVATSIDLDEERRKRGKVFGLVVGRVQSGKTRNYTGLLLKAFDEGWNTVIVLTSDRTTLADQTIGRIQGECKDVDLYVRTIDFGEQGQIRNIGFDSREHYVCIAQKNVNHLRNIEQWIEQLSDEDRQRMKLLVLDDESDNATPDTKQSSSYVLTEADIRNIAANFPLKENADVSPVCEWIRGLAEMDVVGRVLEIGLASDNAAANTIVDRVALEVAGVGSQTALIDLLRDRGREISRILGIDVEVDVGDGQLRWLNELVIEKMNHNRGRRHRYDNSRILQSLVQFVFEVRVERSRINHLVATLFSNGGNIGSADKYHFGDMAYVSYTATPYANILNENPKLDPLASDFIYPMQVSRHYLGLGRIFGRPRHRHDTNPNMRIVREVDKQEMSIVCAVQENADNLKVTPDLEVSWEDPDPDNPENVIQQSGEWKSLKDAIAWLFCATAARRLRRMRFHADDRKLTHRWTTMLFNIGIDQGLHSFLKNDVVMPHLGWIKDNQSEFICRCRRLWCGVDKDGNPNIDGKPHDFTLGDFYRACGNYGEVDDYPLWSEIEGSLEWFVNAHMVGNVHCVVANGSADGIAGMRAYRDVDKKYSYDSDDHIWILCGGYTMSRGLTLDGLVVSYVDRMRKDSAVDTLIQLGRWFGYREEYEMLPRVWLSAASIEEYKKMAFMEDRLHRELQRNFDKGFSPKDDKHYTKAIKLGRRLSGRSAAEIRVGSVGEAFDIFNLFKPNLRSDILKCVNHFVANELGMDAQMRRPMEEYAAQGEVHHRYHSYPYWRGIDSSVILQFLGEYAKFAPEEVQVAVRALSDEIRLIPQSWDVVFSDARPRGEGRDEKFPLVDGRLELAMSNTPCTDASNGNFEFARFSGDDRTFFSGVKTSAIVQGEIDLVKTALSEGVEPPEGWDKCRLDALFAEREANGFREPLPPEIRRAFSLVRMTSKEYREAVFSHVEPTNSFFDGPNPILQIALVRPPTNRGLQDVKTPFAAVSFYWPNHDDNHYTYVAAGDVDNSMDEDGSLAVDKMRVAIDGLLERYGFLTRKVLRNIINRKFDKDIVSEESLDIALRDGRNRYAPVNPDLNDCVEQHIRKSTFYSMSWRGGRYDMSICKCICRQLASEACEAIQSIGGFVECNAPFRDLMWRHYPFHAGCVYGDIDVLFFDMESANMLSGFHIGQDRDGVEGWKADPVPIETDGIEIEHREGGWKQEDSQFLDEWMREYSIKMIAKKKSENQNAVSQNAEDTTQELQQKEEPSGTVEQLELFGFEENKDEEQ